MNPSGFAVTAGFDKALHAVVLCHHLLKSDHEVAGVLVVRAFNPRRLGSLLRSRGPGFLKGALRKLLLGSGSGDRGPLQRWHAASGAGTSSLRTWCRCHGVPYAQVPSLNAPKTLALLDHWSPKGVFYAGGGILRPPFLEQAGHRILNAHMGPLPAIRGMNALEWSLLLGESPTVSIHRIDAGIDTGPVLASYPIPADGVLSLEELRERGVIVGVEGLIACVELFNGLEAIHGPADAAMSRQCFVLAPALWELLPLPQRPESP